MNEDDTYNALTRVPFLTTWNSIGWETGSREKSILEDIIITDSQHVPSDEWLETFEGWTWEDYMKACRDLYDRKYK